jgi:hypothetical protein
VDTKDTAHGAWFIQPHFNFTLSDISSSSNSSSSGGGGGGGGCGT